MKGIHTVLVLGPHTDDGEFGCGGTIARLIEEGKEVFYATFSCAEESVPEGLPKDILLKEVKAASKILGIETYSAFDNVSELTARINDDGWDTSLVEWLKISKFSSEDTIMILSVGGGSENTSQNLVQVMQYAKSVGGEVTAIVSRNGGSAKKLSDTCVLIPTIEDSRITPHAEEWQAILWHMIVSCVKTFL